MTARWWQRGTTTPLPGPISGVWPQTPDLSPGGAAAVRRSIVDRVPGFTPEWRPNSQDDPGVVVSYAFAEQVAAIQNQLNRLPESMARRFLSTAGISLRGSVATSAIVELTIDENAPQAIAVPERSVLVGPATDDGQASVFETMRAIEAIPTKVGAVVLQVGTAFQSLENEALLGSSDLPIFGAGGLPGNVLWLGFTGISSCRAVTMHFTLQRQVTSFPQTTLEWAALLGGLEVPVRVVVDETVGFTRSGLLECQLPDGWDAVVHPSGDGPSTSLRWLIVRLATGGFDVGPRLSSIHVNAVRVESVESLHDELLDPLIDPTAADAVSRYVLNRRPVVPGTVTLDIDSGVSGDPFGIAKHSASPVREWREVESFSDQVKSAHVFMVDPSTGELTFPESSPGAFRRVVAKQYRVSGGTVSFPAGTSLTLRSPQARLSSAVSITAGRGGAGAESAVDALRSGPLRRRAAKRAVTSEDYEIEALAAPGGEASRVAARPGRDGRGVSRPGWVQLIVLSRAIDPSGRFTPSTESLRAIERYLEDGVAPLGVRVVAVAPEFVAVRVEAHVEINRTQDPARLLPEILAGIDRHLDPKPSPTSDGFKFGGVVEHRRIVAEIARISGVESVDVRLSANGRRLGYCEDLTLPSTGLPAAQPHFVSLIVAGARP